MCSFPSALCALLKEGLYVYLCRSGAQREENTVISTNAPSQQPWRGHLSLTWDLTAHLEWADSYAYWGWVNSQCLIIHSTIICKSASSAGSLITMASNCMHCFFTLSHTAPDYLSQTYHMLCCHWLESFKYAPAAKAKQLSYGEKRKLWIADTKIWFWFYQCLSSGLWEISSLEILTRGDDSSISVFSLLFKTFFVDARACWLKVSFQLIMFSWEYGEKLTRVCNSEFVHVRRN